MNILILGGTGSIGCALIELLKSTDWKVYVTSRHNKNNFENISYLEGNAHDINFLSKCLNIKKWDAIIDFMTYSTHEFAQKYNFFLDSTDQYFFLSSSRVYAQSKTPLTEDSPRILDICNDEAYLKTDEYALAKARSENLLFSSGKKNWTIIRPYKTYNNNRFQFGMFEKEDWLYRLIMGKTLVFPRQVAEKKTTLTYASDVALAIKKLIGNPEAYGEPFHITTSETLTWENVFEEYSKILLNESGLLCKIQYEDRVENFYSVRNQYQISYDCCYNRLFDNSKIENVTHSSVKYTLFTNGCRKCLLYFLSHPEWRNIDWKLNFWMDHITGDKTRLWDVIGFREKLRYIKASLYNR